MRKKQKRPEYDKGRFNAGFMYQRHIRTPFRPYSRANMKRDWSNYIPYKKYDHIVRAAHSTGKERYLNLLRAQKPGELTTPHHFAARNPHSKRVSKFFMYPYSHYM